MLGESVGAQRGKETSPVWGKHLLRGAGSRSRYPGRAVPSSRGVRSPGMTIRHSRLPPIGRILGNSALASDIYRSVGRALRAPFARVPGGRSARGIFARALQSAIKDIETHPRRELFRRLIEFGPLRDEAGEETKSGSEGVLSDVECGACVEFVYSHMVNRFKGELAELLSLEPCLALMEQLRLTRRLPAGAQLFWGDTVQERAPREEAHKKDSSDWSGFTKGADGLIVQPARSGPGLPSLRVLGVVEVKSMGLSTTRVLRQIDSHLARLRGGLRLAGETWPPAQVVVSEPVRIIVVPSAWKLSRAWRMVETDGGRDMVLPHEKPTMPQRLQELGGGVWRINLGWSEEALNQAAYEMTFWHMSQVGQAVYTKTRLPDTWAHMTPEEAGYNAIKEALYYMMLRPLSKRHDRLAVRLYNVYSFGYPLGADSREMLWPEDFREDAR